MKFYQLRMMITFLFCSFQADAFWTQWVDTIAAKINNITDVIVHKEFPKAKCLELSNEAGTIVINSWKQDSIAIEVITSCPEISHKDIKVDMECIQDIIKIHTIFTDQKIKGSVVFNILLPKDTDLTITTKQGDIIVKDVIGDLNLETLQGDIKLVNPHCALQAKTETGNILIRTDFIEEAKEFNLISDKGNIELYITQTINSYVHANAPQGKVISDLPITLDSQTTLLNAQAWKNFRQIVHGTIGKPLSTLNLSAHNGSIAIMPYMKQNDIF
ncbi:MAG: hypothetical protein JO129_03100 [Candidatus Dependentiae bacterium]|nr:hypothetical protein [Candidatus Dependentiae bacterium]